MVKITYIRLKSIKVIPKISLIMVPVVKYKSKGQVDDNMTPFPSASDNCVV